MLLTPRYKRPFATFVKKQHKPFQAVIEDEVLEVCANPTRRFIHKSVTD